MAVNSGLSRRFLQDWLGLKLPSTAKWLNDNNYAAWCMVGVQTQSPSYHLSCNASCRNHGDGKRYWHPEGYYMELVIFTAKWRNVAVLNGLHVFIIWQGFYNPDSVPATRINPLAVSSSANSRRVNALVRVVASTRCGLVFVRRPLNKIRDDAVYSDLGLPILNWLITMHIDILDHYVWRTNCDRDLPWPVHCIIGIQALLQVKAGTAVIMLSSCLGFLLNMYGCSRG